MKRLILIVLVFALLLCACGTQPTAEEPSNDKITLWVVTESTNHYGMNDQAQKLATQFENAHENVTIRLDILPEFGEERDLYLEQLRTEIMAGKGPDAYLLPVRPHLGIGELFSDVTQCMYNGIFSDISKFYDADSELNTDELQTAVMNAGMVGDARYVLPLRYDMPVAYVNDSAWDETGLSTDLFSSGITALWEAELNSGNGKAAYGSFGSQSFLELLFYAMNLFPDIIDYENQEVLLTAEEVSHTLSMYQQICSLYAQGTDFLFSRIGEYCWERSWIELGYSVFIDSMSNAMDNAAIARKLNLELSMYPLASTDGTVIADVTYYTAVGSGCNYPELAYEYLRLFLTEEAQWEDIRRDTSGQSLEGLIERGWPVRAVGGITKLWNIIKKQYTGFEYGGTVAESRRKSIQKIKLTDEDIPVLHAQIDVARFSIATEPELANLMMSELNDSANGFAPRDVNIDALAEEIVQNLAWHISEG